MQEGALAKAFGCTRWLWNNSLAETQRVYQETGKGLGQFALNNRLPELKKEFPWLAETHSQVLQSVSLNMSRAFVNFFERRAKYPNFKSKHDKQSIQYPHGVKIVDGQIQLPKIGLVKAVVGWGMFTGFLEYKAARAGKGFIRVKRFLPSSKSCSCCMHVQASMPLNVRAWRCDKCGTLHDRDINAAQSIRAEAQRMIAAGIAGTANRGAVSQGKGRKSSVLAGAVEVRSSVL